MLGPADLQAWSDDFQDDLVADLVADGWRTASSPPHLNRRLRGLHDRFRGGDALTLDELGDLRTALGRG
jgi:hypothetical protein